MKKYLKKNIQIFSSLLLQKAIKHFLNRYVVLIFFNNEKINIYTKNKVHNLCGRSVVFPDQGSIEKL